MTANPHFVPCTAETWRDPFTMYAALRDHDPVHRVEDNGEGEDYWVLSRFEDVVSAANDARTFCSGQGITFSYADTAQLLGEAKPIVMLDGREHTNLRKLTSIGFTPQQVAALEPLIRDFVRERIAELLRRGEGDVAVELFKPVPSLVVAHYLGVPVEDREKFDRWSYALVQSNASGALENAAKAFGELAVYFKELTELRRAEPGPDLISTLVHNPMRDGSKASDMQILGMGFTMVTGGNDTSAALLGGAAELLTRYPEERAKILKEPSLLPNAIEEFLRLTCPLQGIARTATRDVEIGGRTIPKGRRVMLLYASANRDHREFGEDAEECRVDRNIARQLAFSFGPHFCLGAAAARLQARVTLEELLAACPDFSVDWEAGRFAPGPIVRRYESLPFRAKAH